MGLDQSAYHCKPEVIGSKQIGFEENIEREDVTSFAYWRKHPNLQGWMEKLYRSKGGKEEFNCNVVRLEEADLDMLDCAITGDRLPTTSGFFFGQSDHSLSQQEIDLAFVLNARRLLASGEAIFYSSSW
jgi:hypothetical protein